MRESPLLRVVDVDPRGDPRWDVLCAGPGASLFTSPPWLDALAETYRLEPTATVVLDGTRPVAGFAWVELDDEKGRRRSALPFCDYADPVGEWDPARWETVVAPLLEAPIRFSMRTREASLPVQDQRLAPAGAALWHARSLAAEDHMWGSMAPGARQNVRRARRENIDISVDSGVDAILSFHPLHASLRKRKYRMLAQPAQFFRAIGDRFEALDALRVVSATVGDEVVASAVLLRWGRTAYYKFNAATARGYDCRANDLVMWTCLVVAAGWGCDSFDFGLSDADQPGLIRYKRKFAEEEAALRSFDNGVPLDPRARELHQQVGAIASWSTRPEVPDEVTHACGSLLYRFFM